MKIFTRTAISQAPAGTPVPITADNFKRAETGMDLGIFAREGALENSSTSATPAFLI